jgi:uncharacterized protein YkwD
MHTFGLRHALLLIAALTAVALIPRHTTTTRQYDDVGCGAVRDLPADRAPAQVNAAIVCLLNYERRRHGLRPLVRVPVLDVASKRKSDDMVARRYFAHVSPDGVTPSAVVAAAGYVVRPGGTTGENLAWGEGDAGTAASIVDGWMHSPGHRANILRPEFSQIGVGLTLGDPPTRRPTRQPSATYTTEFGG